MSQMIYLDYAAATPLDDAVLAAMQPFFSDQFYNPSAMYLPAKRVHDQLEAARRQVAETLGARPIEVTFTAGGSEANNLAINGVMRQFPGANVVVSAVEHESVLATAGQFDRRIVPVKTNGIVDTAALAGLIDDKTVLLSIMYANNEIGTVQPIKDIGRLVAEVRSKRQADGNKTPLLLHSDAAQAANYLDLHVSRLGVDLMTLNGGKIYGPKQSGCLFVKAGTVLQPQVYGGGQEHGLRSGTENVAACVGFGIALVKAQAMRHAEVGRLQKLQQQFFAAIRKSLPNATVNGSTDKRLPNNVHLTFPGVDNERLLLQLEQTGILAAAGSACSASNDGPSHVLQGLGLDEATARSSLRFTMGRATTPDDVAGCIATLIRLLA